MLALARIPSYAPCEKAICDWPTIESEAKKIARIDLID
jgi:hypothetical protein